MNIKKTEKVFITDNEREALLEVRNIVQAIYEETEESPEIDDFCRNIEDNIDNLLEAVEVE